MHYEETFLTRYGLTPFVSHHKDAHESVFTICDTASRKMKRHAVSLISDAFGEGTMIEIR